jgi:mycofactocin precursor
VVKETGLVEDVSVDGMCLSFSLPLPVAREVSVRASEFSGSGEVTYCEACDYGYLVGLKFAQGSGWNASLWLPQHFLPME